MGTQSVQRTIDLLESISSLDLGGGASIKDLCASLQLTRPTTHRILSSLEHNGLVTRAAGTNGYKLGPRLYYLGLAAAEHFNFADLCAPSLARLADETGDTVFLTERAGFDCVVTSRFVGGYPVKTLTLKVGDLRPLPVGAGAIAILSTFPSERVKAILDTNAAQLPRYTDLGTSDLLQLVSECQGKGYVLNDAHVTPEVRAIGMPIRNRRGVALGAVSIAAISSRITDDRIPKLVHLMRVEIGRIEQAILSEHNATLGDP